MFSMSSLTKCAESGIDGSVLFAREMFVDDILKSLDVGTRCEKKNAVKKFLDRYANDTVFVNSLEKSVVLNLLASLTRYGLVPKVPTGIERDLERSDFDGVSEISSLCMKSLIIVLSDLDRNIRTSDQLIGVFVLCAQHVEDNLWTTSESRARAKELMDLMLRRTSYSTSQDLFNKNSDESFLRNIFSKFPACLSRDHWKLDPGMTAAFKCCLLLTKHPHVGDVLNEVLPISLLFVDDFVVDNRISGLQCIMHVMENSAIAALQWYGRADVIYNALKNLVYTREPRVIVSVYPCLFRVLSMLLPDPKKPEQIRKVTQYDIIYQHFLLEMEAEQVLAIRSAYSQHLTSFIEILGITVLRHLPYTLKVILQYLEIHDGPDEVSRINSLEALEVLISVAWPRLAQHLEIIAKSLIKLMYDVPGLSSHPHCKEIITEKCVKCLKLLRELFTTEIDAMCEPIKDIWGEIPQLQRINDIWLDVVVSSNSLSSVSSDAHLS